VDHPVRVAVDGCSAAGKTTLADEVAEQLRGRSTRAVIRVGIDRFTRPVERRTRYPLDTPDSYYLDSWDRAAIRDELLVPLGPGGNRRYRTAVLDPAVTDPPAHVAPDDAILLADGVFLQRPELDPYWDLRVYVDVDFDEVLRRGVARDQTWMGSAEETARRYRTKYIPGEMRYVAEVRPRERAQIVVDNRDFAAPRLMLR
jgi:uridine kinase